jgi:hypothetical protein
LMKKAKPSPIVWGQSCECVAIVSVEGEYLV